MIAKPQKRRFVEDDVKNEKHQVDFLGASKMENINMKSEIIEP
jgi:hypothetical protein